MNYEELLESRNGAALSKEQMPFGLLYKKMVDDKYANVIDLRNELKDSLVFADALNEDCKMGNEVTHKNQLHFTLATDSAGLYGVRVEQGTYHTFARMLDDNPAIVAGKGFMDTVITNLLDLTACLHDKGIYHICYAPSNVLIRKGDNAPMLLFHGSAYQTVNDQQALYGEEAIPFIAPEVIEEGVFDARADIYSIGKFIEFLYQQSDIPFELRGILKKATALEPEKRYQTPEEMAKAITSRQNTRKSIISGVSAMLVVALLIGLYFTLVPEREDIEFVKPAPKEASQDLLDDGFDPATMDIGADADSILKDAAASSSSEEDVKIDERKMKEYQAKAEQIFRKQFTREAERVLSTIYSNERMNATEKKFKAGSEATMQDLMKAQVRLGNEAGLSDSRSQLVAGQIIEQVSNKLKAQMTAKEKQ